MPDSPENTTATMEIAELDTQRLPLSDVTAHPDNPRIHTQEQIKAIQESYRHDGYIAGSMGIQLSRKRLYKGHAVYEALEGIGVTHADFVVMDLTDEATLALLARDNALSDMSTNDFPKLKAISVELQEMNIPIERMGYTLESMKELESDWAKSEADNRVIEEDDPPEVSEDEPITQTGDLWHLGKHRVLCGDSTKAEDVERVMGGEKADMCVTSPPYYNQRPEYSIFESYSEFNGFLKSIIVQIKRIAGSPFVLIWNTGDNQQDCLPMIADQTILIHGLGFTYVETIIWRKSGALYSNPRNMHVRTNHKFYPALCWEPVIVFRIGEEMPSFDPSDVDAISTWAVNVWDINQVFGPEQKEIGHPAVYPVELAYRCQASYSTAGSVIYDPFLGSGTTLIAADQLDRVCYGLEIAPKYCDVIVKRYIAHRESSDDVWVERGTDRITWEQITRSVKVV